MVAESAILLRIEDLGQKRAREARRESEEKFKAIFDRAAIGLAITDSKGYIIDSNAAYQEMLGYSKDELREKRFAEITYPDDVDRNLELQRQMADGLVEKYQLEKRYIRKDGRLIWCRLTASAIRNPDGSLKNNMAVAEDITERKRAEEMLRESEEKFRMVADSANTGILLVQGEDIVYINQALAGMSGYTVDECMQVKYWDMAPPDRREYLRWAGNARQRGWVGPSRSELKLICKNGDDIWLDCSWSAPTLGGKPAVLVMCVDITGRKQAERDVLKAKAQAELYLDLMGHDINNMNQIAQGFLEMALATLDLAPAQKDLIEKPLGAIQNSSRIIANVRKLQKAESGQYPSKKVDVCSVLEDLKARYSSVPDRKVTINFDYSHPCYVPVNELIGDIFSNIIGNAIKHSDPAKPLVINMGIEKVVWDDKHYFRIMIDDNGPGINDESKAKLFSRFTRGESRASGKGLGLYIARTLVQSYEGKLWVEDRLYGDHTSGTRFVVLLPVAEK
jgi:PAS domain S-box-containing protein